MASTLTPAKRLAVRASLVTGSTIALIVGAQTLITVDVQAGRMNPDGSSIQSDSSNQAVQEVANSGISVIRQANSVTQDQTQQFDQQAQSVFNQPNPTSHRRPRTHSSH